MGSESQQVRDAPCFTALWYLSMSVGYHRLWSHRSYRAGTYLELYLSIAGAACFQGSIREWSIDHRAHHRYVDTDRDPYSIKKGFLYAHIGWLILKSNAERDRVDVTDLDANRIVIWQHRNFVLIAVTAGLAFPSLIAWKFWNDWKGGFVYAGILRIFFFQQATFCVNSLAHWLGDQPYDDKHSPRDHLLTALVTFGEGYHNFHHEFPSDYRNGIEWYQYDPSKWLIWSWEKIKLANSLGRFPQNSIKKGEYQQQQKQLDKFKRSLDWGTPTSQLPLMTWKDFKGAAHNGHQLICISGFVYDVQSFVAWHPGGKAAITSCIGKDATAVFNGGIYSRMFGYLISSIYAVRICTCTNRRTDSNAAHSLLDEFRFGILLGGGELAKEQDQSTT